MDIIATPLKTQQAAARHGVMGTAVISGRVTELVDVETVVRGVDPEFFSDASQPEHALNA
jgi:hypothetical protein